MSDILNRTAINAATVRLVLPGQPSSGSTAWPEVLAALSERGGIRYPPELRPYSDAVDRAEGTDRYPAALARLRKAMREWITGRKERRQRG